MEHNTESWQRENRQSSREPMGIEVYGDRRRGAPSGERIPEVLTPFVNRIPAPIITRNMMRRQADRGLTLVTILTLVLKRKLLFAGLFALLFLPVLAYVVTLPNRYEAEAKLILTRNRTEVAAKGTVPTAGVGEAEVAGEIELLKSHELYGQVVRQAGLAKTSDRRALAEAVSVLEANLKVQPVGKTNIISLKSTSNSAESAARVPNLLAELYLKKHIEVHGNGNAATFLSERTGYYQSQLAEAQKALTHFRQTGDVSLIQEQKQAYLRRATDLKTAMEETDGQLHDAEVRLRLLAKQRNAQPLQVETGRRIVRTSALLERLKGTVIDLLNKRAELVTKYDPQYRLVKEVDQQLVETRAAIERESQPQLADSSQAPNPLRQSLEAESLRLESQAAGLRARRQELSADLAHYRGRQSRLEELTGSNNDLERSVKTAEENYLAYQRKLEEAKLADDLDRRRILNVAVLEHAEAPALPMAQHRAYLILFGLFAAGFGALGGAFVTDYLERNLPSRATSGSQRASDQPTFPEREIGAATTAQSPKYFRRREAGHAPAPMPTVVEIESSALTVRGDAWRELFEKRSRGMATEEAKNGTRG